MVKLICVTGPRGVKIRRALESAGFDLAYFQLDESTPWFERLQMLEYALSAMWKERNHTVALMMDFIGGYSLAALAACRLTGVPFVVRLRGDAWHEMREALALTSSPVQRLFIYRQLLLTRFIIRCADLVIPVSDFLKRRILAEVRGLEPDRIIPVPVFLDLDYFLQELPRLEAREALGLSEDALVVCSVTNFSYRAKARGLYDVLLILDPFMQADGRICWLIAGDGPDQPMFERRVRAQAHAKERVRFLGRWADIRTIYYASDLFIHFSSMDAFPNVVLEAQACGLPVIVNNFGGMPEQVQNGETGYIVDLQEPQAIQCLVRNLLEDPAQRTRIGLAGRRWVQFNYNYRVIGQRFVQALASAERDRRPAG